jgi:hypothetical protein
MILGMRQCIHDDTTKTLQGYLEAAISNTGRIILKNQDDALSLGQRR